jgi:hypothetical protein
VAQSDQADDDSICLPSVGSVWCCAGVKAHGLQRLLALRESSEAIATAVRSVWPHGVQKEQPIQARPNL